MKEKKFKETIELDAVTTLDDLPISKTLTIDDIPVATEPPCFEDALGDTSKNMGLRAHPTSKEFEKAVEAIGAVTGGVKEALKDRPKVSHYQNGKVEPIDLIMSHDLNFNLGNIIKYATRCHLKGQAEQDLKKVIDYANFELERLKGL